MKRPLKPEELRLWALVTSTVHPSAGREPVRAPPDLALPAPALNALAPSPIRPATRALAPPRSAEKSIEPRRKHRIAKDREAIGARIDLHGMTQDRARATLEAFLIRAWDEGFRAILVITGKGVQGDGILRRRAPDWLGAPHLHHIVAGLSEAHRRHGGEGALYVALKRKPRP